MSKIKIAIFASGNGGNFEAIATACRKGEVNADVALCVCDKPGARVCERARRLGIKLLEFNPREYSSKQEFERMIADELDRLGIELVCLAGYMRIIGEELLGRYEGRIINIHPALLPAFPGAHAIADAFAYGVKVYGVTIHYVNSEIDGGRIIAQRAIPYEGRDIEELEQLVHATEHPLYCEVINNFASKKIIQ